MSFSMNVRKSVTVREKILPARFRPLCVQFLQKNMRNDLQIVITRCVEYFQKDEFIVEATKWNKSSFLIEK